MHDNGRAAADPLLLTLLGALVLTAIILGAVAVLHGDGAADPSTSGIDPALLAELSDGGEVILFRHALTDRTQSDADAVTRGTCDMQRNLNDEGIEQARRIGASMRDLDLLSTPILSSPFCRGVDTALAMLDLPTTGVVPEDGTVREEESLRNLTSATGEPAVRDAVLVESTQLIFDNLGGAELVTMVGHVLNIDALTGEQIEEGDAVVLGPSDDGFETLGIIRADDW